MCLIVINVDSTNSIKMDYNWIDKVYGSIFYIRKEGGISECGGVVEEIVDSQKGRKEGRQIDRQMVNTVYIGMISSSCSGDHIRY